MFDYIFCFGIINVNKKEVFFQLEIFVYRAAYMRLSASPEAFFTLRKHFTASYGTMCISHWLLGIGDRHTSNFLISLDTGYVVGIDFGHAFGTGTEVRYTECLASM